MMSNEVDYDVLIIGAGPAGALSAKLLVEKGYSVCVLEKTVFPRFSIGESLLPQCMVFLEEAGLMDAVLEQGFQLKNGAVFCCRDRYSVINFENKISPGPATTFQVQRDIFDHVLANEAERSGAKLLFEAEVVSVEVAEHFVKVRVITDSADGFELKCRYILDASGFGRTLPRLLNLEEPSSFPVRQSFFTHIKDNISKDEYDRNKILVGVHPRQQGVWYWVIPFSNGRCSIGVVAEPFFFEHYSGDDFTRLQHIIKDIPGLESLLVAAEYDTDVRQLRGYSFNVKSLYGERFLLLGNAGEFLDPIFSSGVTIALKSASLAANLLDKYFRGESVDWEHDFARELQRGVNVFRTYVEAWYDGRFLDVLSHPDPNPKVISMISSILAGYAWDQSNPMVNQSSRRLDMLVELCRAV